MEQTLSTNQGTLTIDQILDQLSYNSYAAQRDYGMGHERLVYHGLGNEAYKERYEAELKQG